MNTDAQLMERLEEHSFPTDHSRRIYMSFVRNAGGWYCRFHRDDLRKTPITRRFVFQGAQKIYDAARRGNGLASLESSLDLSEAITIGRGGIWLHLSEGQYSSLVAPSTSTRGHE